MRSGSKVIANNKKAYHDYYVEQKYEAGVELKGSEVKSIRLGRINLKDSWCSVVNGEMLMHNVHISPYDKGSFFNEDPDRDRKLLMHKREILKLFGQLQQQGLSLIPLSAYLKSGRVKIELGLCKGKKLYDKRESIARKTAEKNIQRAIKEASKV